MAAINAETRRQRGLFGLLCGTISIKKNFSCIGDSSVTENESSDPNENCKIDDVPVAPASPPLAIPSPVLVSKKLAEEAVAKRRNVRFRHQATVIEEGEETNTENGTTVDASEKLITENDSSQAVERKSIRRSRQKKMAPAPPIPVPTVTANAS